MVRVENTNSSGKWKKKQKRTAVVNDENINDGDN